jgi:hypothetical protein
MSQAAWLAAAAAVCNDNALYSNPPECLRPPCQQVGLLNHGACCSSKRGQAQHLLQLTQPQQHLAAAAAAAVVLESEMRMVV